MLANSTLSSATIAAEPGPIELDLQATALVIIDMQRDFLEPGGFGETLGNDVSQLARAVQPCADVLKLAMVKLGTDDAAPGARMILTVHDELVFEVPEERAKAAGEQIREQMAGAMKLAVPLVVDVGWGKNWAKAH